MNEQICKCCRCRFVHRFNQRKEKKEKKDKCLSTSVCPRCSAESYYVVTKDMDRALNSGVGGGGNPLNVW